MENLLREYLEKAFAERGIGDHPGPRPVVTLSREFGCPSKPIAHILTHQLNQRDGAGKSTKWRFINKEVVEATARHLEINSTEVNYLLSSGGKGLVEDVLASFSPNYVSNVRMRKTIITVVRSIADQGYVVIVGRGGVGILQDHPNAVHVRLMAPPEWRVSAICELRQLTRPDAVKLVAEMDRKRMAFIEMFTGGKFNPYLFNMALNCSILSKEEIAATIIGMMESKKMI